MCIELPGYSIEFYSELNYIFKIFQTKFVILKIVLKNFKGDLHIISIFHVILLNYQNFDNVDLVNTYNFSIYYI